MQVNVYCFRPYVLRLSKGLCQCCVINKIKKHFSHILHIRNNLNCTTNHYLPWHLFSVSKVSVRSFTKLSYFQKSVSLNGVGACEVFVNFNGFVKVVSRSIADKISDAASGDSKDTADGSRAVFDKAN